MKAAIGVVVLAVSAIGVGWRADSSLRFRRDVV